MIKLLIVFLLAIAAIVGGAVIAIISYNKRIDRNNTRRAQEIAATMNKRTPTPVATKNHKPQLTYAQQLPKAPIPPQSQSIPSSPSAPQISQEAYISQLKRLYSQYGNNVFQHTAEIKVPTGYERRKIHSDLEALKISTRATVNKKEYMSQLEDLLRKFGNNAFQHLEEIEAQTGYERWEIKADLKEIRSQIEASQKQPQNSSSQSSTSQYKPRKCIPRWSTNPSVPQKAPTPSPKVPSKPILSIEEQILNYLKSQPVKWEFPPKSQDNTLKNFCSSLVFSENVAAVYSDEVIKSLELTIQQKRARNPQLADHNAAMEGNILALLYKYSYLMHTFHVMDAIKFDTTKVDTQKLWLLIQQDCNTCIGNLAEEKRKNPAIQTILSKYTYDHQTMRLKVLTDATGREMDYIISSLMANSLVTIISLLFSNPQLLQTIKPYSADDIAGMMDAHIATAAAMKFTTYSR